LPTLSLNTLQADNVAHGADIQLQAQGLSGGLVTIADIYEMDLDEDHDLQELGVLGSRISGARRGRFKVSGSLKAYWINGWTRTLWGGAVTPLAGGSASAIYHSQIPFQRYLIQITGLPSSPLVKVINVIFHKDSIKWTESKFTEETLTFDAEDVFSQ
jgi:hypothetical protein